MTDPVHAFQQAILNPGTCLSAEDDLLARVVDAVKAMDGTGAVGTADLAGLVRQCLLRISLESDGSAQLRVPRGKGWPTLSEWELFGCCATIAGASEVVVRAEGWHPCWLDERASQVVEDAVSRAQRRSRHSVPIDPVLTPFGGYTTYSSVGQRAAMRAAFLMPAGTSLIVDLPTGAGKSLVFQIPTLVHRPSGALTVVIVPTVALARDQELRFSDLKDSSGNRLLTSPDASLAYHSGLSAEEKAAVITALREGRAPILFTSPEAALGALRGPLFQAAEQQRLRYLVIDEAHLITQWGQQFRPEFQSLAGLRDSLRMACPLKSCAVRTLLLTATLTQECLDTIRLLFGDDECQFVGQLSLRTEPGFLISQAVDGEERDRRVIEAIRFLPRPLILYTTLREDAEKYLGLLHQADFQRIRLIRGGDMSDIGAGELLRDWQRGHFDIVVATSAFGLGVDHSEVRSVIHACLPETVDRYYQEVGRTGRDGRASVALLVTAPNDWDVAESLAKERLISVQRGFERWQSMWVRKTMGPGRNYVVNLNERPADIDQSGPRNISWNLRTLILMVQAGLIRLLPHRPPQIQQNENETEEEFNLRRSTALNRFVTEIPIDLLDPRHSSKAHWDSVVRRTRERLYFHDRQSLELVAELLDLKRPLNHLFREIYTLANPDVRPPYVSGSCPVTRHLGTESFENTAAEAIECTSTIATPPELHEAISNCSDAAQRCWVSMSLPGLDRAQHRRTLSDVLRCLTLLVSRGVIEIAVPDGYLSQRDWDKLRNASPINFVIRATDYDDPFSPPPLLARASVMPLVVSELTMLQNTMLVQRPTHIIFFPENVLDPRQPSRRLRDMVPHCALDTFISRLSL
ncbi:MAG: protein DpdF [Bryobacteraceae bacterium]